MIGLARIIAALGLTVAAWLRWDARGRQDGTHEPLVRLAVNHPLAIMLAMATAAIALAAFVVVSGVVPIKASSGHWLITAALLDFAKTRSVAFQSWGIEAPQLDDEALILRGAAHYELACLPCHGAPGRRMPPTMRAMTPPPPELTARISRWAPEELFSIIKHGIKFTGMPAWPAPQRNDEVWAMVAFLRRLPSFDAHEYRRLARGDDLAVPDIGAAELQPPIVVSQVCRSCHGLDGIGRGSGAFPNLAGQRAQYLYLSLKAFADNRRYSGIMAGVAANLSDAMMQEAAGYYSRLSPKPNTAVDAPAVARGESIATLGVLERDIPACAECHGPTLLPKNPAYPRLDIQNVRYLVDQLRLLQARQRGGSPNVNLMHVFVDRLHADEIRDVALSYGIR